MDRQKLVSTILIALFAALVAAGAFIRIPLPPVPVTLQTLFALLASQILPLPQALSSILVYIFIGLAGLPVFTSGGGPAAMLGPTGGYIMGLVPAVIVAGLVEKLMKRNTFLTHIVSGLVETVMIYIFGLFWLGWTRKLSIGATLASGLLPFIVGDTVKLIASAFVATRLKDRVSVMLSKKEDAGI